MSLRTLLRGDRSTHVWEADPARRAENGGVGGCNRTEKRVVCAIGVVGCDVDHLGVAEITVAEKRAASE